MTEIRFSNQDLVHEGINLALKALKQAGYQPAVREIDPPSSVNGKIIVGHYLRKPVEGKICECERYVSIFLRENGKGRICEIFSSPDGSSALTAISLGEFLEQIANGKPVDAVFAEALRLPARNGQRPPNPARKFG